MQKNIEKLLSERYYLETEKSWEDLAKRVSSVYPNSFELIKNKRFVPSSPTLMNANTGGKRKGTLSSCFTMDIDDSIEGIFDSLKDGAIVTKASGGVGYVFSKLRSSNENVESLNRKSSGPIPFMRIFNSMLDGIQQGGVRRGAGMGQFDMDHPDILDVIRIKNSKGELERLNISIRMTDEFYSKLKNNPDSVHLVKKSNGETFELKDNNKSVTVKNLWDEIIEYAWKCAEPGIFNIDIATKQCAVTNLNNYVLSNPCSEFVNIPYASCNLGSVNLVSYVKDNGEFDWELFEKDVRVATRFLDQIIDINDFPIQKIKEVTQKIRPIGLGAMGYAHMLYKMKIPFNSDKARKLTNTIFRRLTMISMDESCEMAKENGSYEVYDFELYKKANERFFDGSEESNSLLEKIKTYGIRNSCSTSIAPTGSIAFITNVSSGIEPVFALTYARKIEKLNKEYEVVYISDPIFAEYLNENFDKKTQEKILKQVAENKGSCQNVEEIPENDKKVFLTANDLTPMEHLENLALVARNTSLSVSKTVNIPHDAKKEDISEIYLKAHEMGIIGVTVYRDGCRDGVLVHNVDIKEEDIIVKTNAPKRPKSLPCHVYKINVINRESNQPEKWIVFVGLLKGEPYEIIAGKVDGVDIPSSITNGDMIKIKRDGKNIYQFWHNGELIINNVCEVFLNELREYVTRLMSWGLRHGAGIDYLKDVLQKSNGTIVDFNKAIIRAITKYQKNVVMKERCPTCNEELIYVDGCIKCKNMECSYSKCS